MLQDKNYYSEIESCKLFFELFKHLTTLSSSTVVISGTFIGNVFKNPECTVLIVITFICFISCILFGVLGMFVMASHSRGKESSMSLLLNLASSSLLIGAILFISGFITFSTFIVKNF